MKNLFILAFLFGLGQFASAAPMSCTGTKGYKVVVSSDWNFARVEQNGEVVERGKLDCILPTGTHADSEDPEGNKYILYCYTKYGPVGGFAGWFFENNNHTFTYLNSVNKDGTQRSIDKLSCVTTQD